MEIIKEEVGDNFPIVLIGNKCDKEYEKEISKEEGEQKAKELGLHFYESSCLKSINVQEPLFDLAEQMFARKKEQKNKKY